MNIPNAKLLSLASIASSALLLSMSTNVIAAEVWSTPGALSPSETTNANYPAVSVNNNGSTVFTYYRDTARAGFRSPEGIFTPTSTNLDVGVISSGVVRKIVTNQAGDTAALVDFAGELSLRLKPKDSTAFSGKIALTAPGELAYTQNIPDVVIDSQGRVTAVWQNTSDNIVVRRINIDSTTAEAPISLATSSSPKISPSISANPQGDVAVVWISGPTQETRVAYRFSASPTFTPSRVISKGSGLSGRRFPLAAVSADRSATFAWIIIDGMSQYLIATQQSDITDASTLDASETVVSEKVSQIQYSTNYVRPKLVVNSQGQAVFGWIGTVGGKGVNRAQAVIKTDSTTYSPIRLLSPDDADAQSFALTTPANGKSAVFVSQKNKVSSYFVKDNDFLPGPVTGKNASFIGVNAISAASDNEGNAIVIWDGSQDTTTGDSLISYATLDVSGPRFPEVNIPAQVERGKAITLSVRPEDTWNDTTQVHWDFDDFSEAGDGSSIKHTFSTSRTVAITITATDSVGNSRKIERSIRVVDPPPPPTTTTTPPPPPPPPATTTPEKPPVTPETPVNLPIPETPRNPTVNTQYCTVSQLTGLTLPKAKTLLENGKCSLGTVKKPATSKTKARKLTRKGYRLVVVAQSAGPKTQLEVNAKINLTLGWRKVSAKK